MSTGTLSTSERSGRSISGTAGTMVAVMLLLAILPGAAVLSSPVSAAILDSTLGVARVSHVQRERPNPTPGKPVRMTWGAEFGKVSAAGEKPRTVSRGIGPLRAVGCVGDSPERPRRLFVMVRCGTVCLPPPVSA